jgi:hypothetical protein
MTDLKIVQTPNAEPPEPFLIAFAEWMKARAVNWAIEATPDADDDQVSAGNAALIAAEWMLLQTPAKTLLHIRLRAEATQAMIIAADHQGRPTDNRHHLMVSALVSEIQRFTA